MADIDFVLSDPKPANITDESTEAQKVLHANWTRANKMLYAIRRTMSEHLLGRLDDELDARTLYEAMGERYKRSSQAESGNLMTELMNLKYESSEGVRDFVLKIVHLQKKLVSHQVIHPDRFIVHHAIRSLPHDFNQLKTSYTHLMWVGVSMNS